MGRFPTAYSSGSEAKKTEACYADTENTSGKAECRMIFAKINRETVKRHEERKENETWN